MNTTISSPPATGRRVYLTIFSTDDLPVLRVARFWTAFQRAYSSLAELEITLLSMASMTRLVKSFPDAQEGEEPFFGMSARAIARIARPYRATRGNKDILMFSRIKISSPGFWEVVGKWAPLETIRKSLNDAHERKKDISYRQKEEAKQLILKNSILEAQAVQEWIKTLKEAGASEEQIQAIIRERIATPLKKMNDAALPSSGQHEAAVLREEE